MRFQRSDRFDEKLSAIRLVDARCADLVEKECDFFASEAAPRPGYEAGDIWVIPVEEIGGDPVCTAFAIIQRDLLTYFDIIYEAVPDESLEDD